MKIVLAGTIDGISTLKDGSIKVAFATQEMNSGNAAQLFELRGKYVKVLFSDSNITELESNVVDSERMTGTRKKSKSSRLRACLFIEWEQSGLQVDFENYYATRMEQIIDAVKMNLNQEAA